MRIPVTQKIAAAFGSALLILVVGAMSAYMLNRFLHATTQVDHTVTVMSEAAEALSALKDAETGQRGFIITGDSVYLTPYLEARESLAVHRARLRALTADNPAQQQRLDSLDHVTGDKLAELAATITLRHDSGFAAAVAQVRTDRGRKSMEAARSLVAVSPVFWGRYLFR